MKKKVAVALSGGLDSAVTASLLIEENFQVIGIHFSTGYSASLRETHIARCEPAMQVKKIAEYLGIPLETVDCSRDFSQQVVSYFVETYGAGQTPNPCVVCNRLIKFGPVLEYSKGLGAEVLATGHYARVIRTDRDYRLFKGVDAAKDQSYFLCRLNQDHLRYAVFPLGVLTKNKVREMAERRGLAPLTGDESQELCFVNASSYKDFLADHGVQSAGPGPIVNLAGKVLGKHQGLHRHTIGQRRGIGVPGPEPYYVLRLERDTNRLVVGTKTELATGQITVSDINWIGGHAPQESLHVKTRIRYRHKEAPSFVTPLSETKATVLFTKPQNAVAPGQAAVFYDGEHVLGGGWITAADAP